MQCGSNLLTTFLAFDCGGGLVSVPRSGMGASGGEGGASGLSRDELSRGVPAGACAQSPIPSRITKTQIPRNRLIGSPYLHWRTARKNGRLPICAQYGNTG